MNTETPRPGGADSTLALCPFGEDAAPGAGCIRPAGHDGPHYVVPGDGDGDAR